MQQKVAVYCGTRNVYEDMWIAAKSLLIHSDVDKIYFLIEDDDIGFELPSEIECKNISNQAYFITNGPNFKSKWTYIILLRAAFTKIFPQYDKILSLDVDTIINENISELWDISLDNYYIAGVREPTKSTDTFLYINTGVLLFNLKQMREDKIDDKLIDNLNHTHYNFPEQDCMNKLCQNYILELPSDYNVNNYTSDAMHRKIIHYAAIKNYNNLPLFQYYKQQPIKRNIKETFDLDIIIPTYNNAEGLITTLESVYYPELNIKITVIDDCSTINYDDIIKRFPAIQYFKLKENSGPGVARQYGINHTINPYILFVDCGDFIISKFALLEILDTIKNHTAPDCYSWSWLNEEHHSYNYKSILLHGWVYKRSFLELYNITFSTEGSRLNEDIGFNHAIVGIITALTDYDNTPHLLASRLPVYFYTYNTNSITHKNNKEFLYQDQIIFLIKNIKHVIEIFIKNNIPKNIIQKEICQIFMRLYFDFLHSIQTKPEYAEENWQWIRLYYFDVYLPNYDEEMEEFLSFAYSQYIKKLINMPIHSINIRRFLKELADFENVPEHYYLNN